MISGNIRVIKRVEVSFYKRKSAAGHLNMVLWLSSSAKKLAYHDQYYLSHLRRYIDRIGKIGGIKLGDK